MVMVLLLLPAWRQGRADVLPLLGTDGRLVCGGRSGARSAIAALPEGDGFLVVTRDARLDPEAPPDDGFDLGLLRLDAALQPLPVNSARGGDDPCGALLLGGTGDQRARAVIAIGPGRFLLAAD
jgi:hypothetical protein